MKIKTILILGLLLTTLLSFGQKKEQIKALKTAFITTELNLSPQEAEKFWPLYNVYDYKQSELRNKKIKGYLKRMDSDIDELSEKEASILLAQIEAAEEENYLNRKKFIASLKDVISPLKIIKLKKAEEDFNRKLLRQYGAKKRNKG